MTTRIALAIALASAALTFAAGQPSQAQQPDMLAPGATVRWTDPVGQFRIEGSVQSVRDDSIVVVVPPGSRLFALSVSATRSLAIRDGRGSRGRGALIGAAIGGGAGVLLGLAAGNSCSNPEVICISPRGVAEVFGVLFGGIGAIVGAAVTPAWRWRLVNYAEHQTRVAVEPMVTWHAAPVVGLRVTF
ncbi:MAG: hypothetical protein ACREL5_03335 [Gemmatimonadales bacterium]